MTLKQGELGAQIVRNSHISAITLYYVLKKLIFVYDIRTIYYCKNLLVKIPFLLLRNRSFPFVRKEPIRHFYFKYPSILSCAAKKEVHHSRGYFKNEN